MSIVNKLSIMELEQSLKVSLPRIDMSQTEKRNRNMYKRTNGKITTDWVCEWMGKWANEIIQWNKVMNCHCPNNNNNNDDDFKMNVISVFSSICLTLARQWKQNIARIWTVSGHEPPLDFTISMKIIYILNRIVSYFLFINYHTITNCRNIFDWNRHRLHLFQFALSWVFVIKTTENKAVCK